MAVEDRYATAPFREAIEYLRDKISLDTDSWRDIADDEHDAFFVVAGAKGSLLSELRAAVDKAIERGQRPEDFQAAFEQITEGWEYRGDAGWRSQIIFRTNLRASYGRGRDAYQQDPEVQRLQPYLQYTHGDSLNPRPSHLALDGKVFRANAIPFPLPAGYGCSCRYVSLSQRELERAGLSVSEIQKGDSVTVEMPDGQVQQAVIEPDPGWDRTPGMPSEARRQDLIQRVIDRSPPEIAAQIRAEVEAYDQRRRQPSLLAALPEQIKQAMAGWLEELRSIDVPDDRVMEKVWDAEYVAQEIEIADTSKLRGLSDGERIQAAASVFVDRNTLYVEHIGKAPWSLNLNEDARSRPEAAQLLMSQLAQESIERGFEGRLELTALPGAVDAYERMGFERGRGGRYYLSPEKAAELIERMEGLSFMEYDYGDEMGPCVKDLDKWRAFKDKRRAEWNAKRAQQAQTQGDGNGESDNNSNRPRD